MFSLDILLDKPLEGHHRSLAVSLSRPSSVRMSSAEPSRVSFPVRAVEYSGAHLRTAAVKSPLFSLIVQRTGSIDKCIQDLKRKLVFALVVKRITTAVRWCPCWQPYSGLVFPFFTGASGISAQAIVIFVAAGPVWSRPDTTFHPLPWITSWRNMVSITEPHDKV